MEPQACYEEIVDAMHLGELALAHELALAMKDWLDRSGIHSRHAIRSDIDTYLARVLRRTAHLP